MDPNLPTDYIWSDATHTIRWTTFPNRANGMLAYMAKDAEQEGAPGAPNGD